MRRVPKGNHWPMHHGHESKVPSGTLYLFVLSETTEQGRLQEAQR